MSGTGSIRFRGYPDLAHRRHEVVADRFDTTRISWRGAAPLAKPPKAESVVEADSDPVRT